MSQSNAHGRCVLALHFTGTHINAGGVRFKEGRRAAKHASGVFTVYLNKATVAELRAEAESLGVSPGAIIKESVLKRLGLE